MSPAGSSVGCAEYEPDLVLDNISFAQTASGFASSAVSTTHSANGTLPSEVQGPTGGVHAILMESIRIDNNTTGAMGEEGEDDTEADETARIEEREEERGFMRALGLECESNTNRATSE